MELPLPKLERGTHTKGIKQGNAKGGYRFSPKRSVLAANL